MNSRRDFAFALLRQCVSVEGTSNVLLGPSSVYEALAIVVSGARGETREQLARALGSVRARTYSDEGLAEAAAIFVDRAFALTPEFSERAVRAALAEPGADRIVNAWVAEKTR